ncbi:MAG: hypothetical protein WCL21_20085 [Mariniphaga sp.]
MASTTTVSSGQQSIPTVLEPYFTGDQQSYGLLPKAQEIFARDYATAYGNTLQAQGLEGAGRIAGMSPTEVQAGQQIANMQQPGQFATGYGAYQQGLGALNSMTDPNATQQYMSPYAQNVIDVNKAEALRDAQKNLVGANLASSRQGTYGGARNALMQSEAERNLQTKMGGIQATGMQNAFEAAQKAQLGSAAAYGNLGQGLGQQGALQEQSDLARATALGAYGGSERAVGQQQLDAQYQDQMRALAFPEQQLGSLSNILRGVPLGDTAGTQTTTAPPPSFASQLAGVGLSGLSLFNMLGKG